MTAWLQRLPLFWSPDLQYPPLYVGAKEEVKRRLHCKLAGQATRPRAYHSSMDVHRMRKKDSRSHARVPAATGSSDIV